MPIYEYECNECAHRTERLQRMDAPPLEKCPECGGPVRRLVSAPAVQFKGSGWYVTDYARKGSQGGNGSGDSGSGPSESKKTDSAKSDAKSDAKPDAKKSTAAKSSGE